MKKFRIAAYISGSGSNLRKVIESCIDGTLSSQVVSVISDKNASGLDFPASKGIETTVISRKGLKRSEFIKKQLEILNKHSVDLIILAGYLKKLAPEIVAKYEGKILNIHPALLPKYGGKGFHGQRVHKAVIEAGDKYSGPTVHFVDNKYDNGEVLLRKKVPVSENETPESLQKKVLKEEHNIFTQAIKILEERDQNEH